MQEEAEAKLNERQWTLDDFLQLLKISADAVAQSGVYLWTIGINLHHLQSVGYLEWLILTLGHNLDSYVLVCVDREVLQLGGNGIMGDGMDIQYFLEDSHRSRFPVNPVLKSYIFTIKTIRLQNKKVYLHCTYATQLLFMVRDWWTLSILYRKCLLMTTLKLRWHM